MALLEQEYCIKAKINSETSSEFRKPHSTRAVASQLVTFLASNSSLISHPLDFQVKLTETLQAYYNCQPHGLYKDKHSYQH